MRRRENNVVEIFRRRIIRRCLNGGWEVSIRMLIHIGRCHDAVHSVRFRSCGADVTNDNILRTSAFQSVLTSSVSLMDEALRKRRNICMGLSAFWTGSMLV